MVPASKGVTCSVSPTPGTKPRRKQVQLGSCPLFSLPSGNQAHWLTGLGGSPAAPGEAYRVTHHPVESGSLENTSRASVAEEYWPSTMGLGWYGSRSSQDLGGVTCLTRAWFSRTHTTVRYFCFRYVLLLKCPSSDLDSCARRCSGQTHPELHPVYGSSQQIFNE